MNELLTSTASPDVPAGSPAVSEAAVTMRPVRFPPASADQPAGEPLPLARFYDVTVNVTAELGRASMRLSDLMRLGVGSVVELGRLVDQPIEIFAQGVRLGRGDVVTVNDQYAVRITELDRFHPPAEEPHMGIVGQRRS
jgi:flagellar motor switch protein FliN/FliY